MDAVVGDDLCGDDHPYLRVQCQGAPRHGGRHLWSSLVVERQRHPDLKDKEHRALTKDLTLVSWE